MACTTCNDSGGNKNKSSKSSASGGTSKSGFKSGMNLLIQAKRIWQQTASKKVEPIEPAEPEQNNDNNG